LSKVTAANGFRGLRDEHTGWLGGSYRAARKTCAAADQVVVDEPRGSRIRTARGSAGRTLSGGSS
jgi:hypothetical protein